MTFSNAIRNSRRRPGAHGSTAEWYCHLSNSTKHNVVFDSAPLTHYMKTWGHAQNRKYIAYCTVVEEARFIATLNMYRKFHEVWWFLANVNSRSRSLYAIARPSVVCLSSVICNLRAPYSAGWNFRQWFFATWYLGHPLTFNENFTEIVPGKSLHQGGGLNARGV